MPYTLEIKGLSKNFGDICAVQNLSLKAKQGEVIALLGPNGAGKSTLMNMISGYLVPSAGEIKVLGKNIRNYPIESKQNHQSR